MDVTQSRAAVWWMAVDTVDTAQWPRLAALLDDAERGRAGRFHFEHDRRAYVAAHALGRILLSSWAGGRPQDWRFAIGDHGKPEVVVPTGAPRLRLNLSHTRGLAAAALTVEHDIGLDVEWLDGKADGMELARHFFAADEYAQLERTPPELATEAFLAFWTLKEAYVKAIGKGLAQPLDGFAFTLDPLTIRFHGAPGDDPARWRFHRFRPGPRHVMALALGLATADEVTVEAMAQTAGDLL
jgi:Phosphopantetheinyl transferase